MDKPRSNDPTDPFDTLLTLEDTLYTSAFAAGAQAGAQLGRIEARHIGLTTAFERFANLGQFHGRSAVWAARCGSANDIQPAAAGTVQILPRFEPNARLKTNVERLYVLTHPDTLDMRNTDEAVAMIEDVEKRASAKAKVIARVVGESERTEAKDEKLNKDKGEGNMEDFAGSRILR